MRGLLPVFSCAAVLGLAAATLARGAEIPTRVSETALREGEARVLVRFDESIEAEGRLASRSAVGAQRARIAGAGRRLPSVLAGTHSRIVHVFETVPYAAAVADSDGLAALARSPLVAAIEEDGISLPALSRSLRTIDADVLHRSGFDGAGQTLAILDTGIDSSHPFFAGRIVSEACFSASSSCPNGNPVQLGGGAGAPCSYDPGGCNHGTHVAGIAAGSGPEFSGVAPAADLISVQIFSRFDGPFCGGQSPCAASYTSDQVAALERVISLAETYPIAAVNMSIGGNIAYPSSEACDASNGARKAAVDHLRSLGIVVVAASGNEGFTFGLTSPSCISSVLSVGATTDDDRVLPFSNSASYLDLLAPGDRILSSKPGGGFRTSSGTSMAAPQVAGAIALLRQHSPALRPNEIIGRIANSGTPVTDDRNGVTTPRVSVLAAVSDASVGTRGLLEFPADGGVAGGVGTFAGWLCDAESVLVRVDGGEPLEVAYGTPRNDTESVCGDTANGLSLLYNFNRDGNGVHTAELIADGVVVSTSTYTVNTFGVPFLRGAESRSYVLEDFEGRDVTVQWREESQGFEITDVE